MSISVASESAVLGQIASNAGYSDFIGSLTQDSPYLKQLVEDGVSTHPKEVAVEAQELANHVGEDIASTAKALAELCAGQDVIAITDGLGISKESEKVQKDFDPNQARDESGKWTSGGGAGAGKTPRFRISRDPKDMERDLKNAVEGARSADYNARVQAEFARMQEAQNSSIALNKDQEGSLSDYMGFGYKSINECLRVNSCTEGSKANIQNLAFVGKSSLSQDLITFRGSRIPASEVEGIKPGAFLSDKGFVSSSTNLNVATSFMKSSSEREQTVFFRIASQAGKPAYVTPNKSENEILFPPGSRFYVRSVAKVDRTLFGSLSGGTVTVVALRYDGPVKTRSKKATISKAEGGLNVSSRFVWDEGDLDIEVGKKTENEPWELPFDPNSEDPSTKVQKAKAHPSPNPFRNKLLAVMQKKFHSLANELADKIGRLGKASNSRSQAQANLYVDMIDWDDVVDEAEAALLGAYANAGTKALATVHMSSAGMIDKVNSVARDWARGRAAELVGKKRVGDTLIDNPNAKYAISETTREELREIIENAFTKETKISDLAGLIRDAGAFSDSRAEMIAHTEVHRAEHLGNLSGWKESGVVEKVNWNLSADHEEDSDECDDLADGSPYPVDDAPDIPHPRCRCSLTPHFDED